MSLTHDDVRAAGGIVHSDGNIFFTNIDKLNATAAPLLERIKELERHNKALVERRQHDVADINDGVKKLVDLEQQLEAARKDAGWISVKECMPPPDSRCLVWFCGDLIGVAHTFTKWKHPSHPLGYLIQGHGGSHNDVTHWMPLPPPPIDAAISKEQA